MADNASTVYLKDKDSNIILPATDWSAVNNKPNNLATTDQLPVVTSGGQITLNSNAVIWNAGPNQWASFKYINFGGAKLIEVTLIVGLAKQQTSQVEIGTIPQAYAPSDYLYSMASPQSYFGIDGTGHIYLSPSAKDNNTKNTLETWQMNSARIFYLK